MSAVGPSAINFSFSHNTRPFQNSVAIDVSSADSNMSAVFTTGWATGLYVGGSGDVALQLFGDTGPTVFKALSAGQMLTGLQIVKVLHTNTTATNLVVLL